MFMVKIMTLGSESLKVSVKFTSMRDDPKDGSL